MRCATTAAQRARPTRHDWGPGGKTAGSEQNLSDDELAELAAFADGSLAPKRRGPVAARVEGSPELRALVAEQRSALERVGAIDLAVPDGLKSRIEAQASPRRKGRPRFRRAGLAGGLAAALAVVAMGIILLAGGGSSNEPSIDQIAGLSSSAATAPAPGPGTNHLLAASVGGVSFPDYEQRFGWRATGERSDGLDGRATRTIYYERGGERIAYSIVDGEKLPWQPEARKTTRDGVELRVHRRGAETTVSWLRGGHTCVLSARGVAPRELAELAAWKGEGAVTF